MKVRTTEYMTLLSIVWGTIDIDLNNLEKYKVGVK